MKKYFVRGKIFAGSDRRVSVPLCYEIGKAVFTHASDTVKAPFIRISRGAGAAGDLIQMSLGDAICALGGEVLLIDNVPEPAAALLTRRYRADITLVESKGNIEILDSRGYRLSRADEMKIEEMIASGSLDSKEKKLREGEIYSRRDAYLDYAAAILELSGNRKINTKILLDCVPDMQKPAEAIFARLTKNLMVPKNAQYGSTELGEITKASGAAAGFRIGADGRSAEVSDADGKILTAEEVYCLLAAKMAERNIFGSTVKETTGRGISLRLSENGLIHFADLLPGADGFFTAAMLSIYIADKDESLAKLADRLRSPQNP